MQDQHPDLDHHLAELHQVASELRAARQAFDARRAADAGAHPGVVRTAVGRLFLSIATALLAEPTSSRLAAR
jgi:hypothetical protein